MQGIECAMFIWYIYIDLHILYTIIYNIYNILAYSPYVSFTICAQSSREMYWRGLSGKVCGVHRLCPTVPEGDGLTDNSLHPFPGGVYSITGQSILPPPLVEATYSRQYLDKG